MLLLLKRILYKENDRWFTAMHSGSLIQGCRTLEYRCYCILFLTMPCKTCFFSGRQSGWTVPYSAGQSYSVLSQRFFPQILSSSAPATIPVDLAAEEVIQLFPGTTNITLQQSGEPGNSCSQLHPGQVCHQLTLCYSSGPTVLLSYENQELPLCLLPHNQPSPPCSSLVLWGCSYPFLKVLSEGSSPHVLLNVPNQKDML